MLFLRNRLPLVLPVSPTRMTGLAQELAASFLHTDAISWTRTAVSAICGE